MNFFNKHKSIVLILIMVSFLFPSFVFAQTGTCSPNGYSIYTINGINTDQDSAIKNRNSLKNLLLFQSSDYNNQPLTVDFLYNPTHVLGIDLLDSVFQKYFDQNSYDIQDSDFGHILTDASAKLNTQKVLLVAHSQGNFYANTFYDAVADQDGGVPYQSIGVYGVASPANYIAGSGLYVTSDTDKIIAGLVAKAPKTNILKPNIHIDFQNSDGDLQGHNFSKIYLQYEGDRIVSDIQASLNRLQSNSTQKEDSPCISPPKLTRMQKIQGAALSIIDTSVNAYNKALSVAGDKYLAFINGAGKILADIVTSVGSKNSATVVLSDSESKGDTSSLVSHSASDNLSDSSGAQTSNSSSTSKPKDQKNTIIPNPIAIVTIKPIILPNSPVISSAPQSVYANFLPRGGNITPINIVASLTAADPVPPTPPEPIPIIPPDPIPPPPPPIDPPVPPPAPPAPPILVADTTPPIISILGKNPLNIFLGSKYHDAGAIALDDIDGAIIPVVDGAVDAATPGTYQIGYTATDSSSNTIRVVRTVNILTLSTNFPPNESGDLGTTEPDTHWTIGDSPHVVSGPLYFTVSKTLTIDPGVVVKFADANSYILIYGGVLKAEGTATDKIYFTSIKDDTVGGDTNADGSATVPSSEDWRGLYIVGGDPNYPSSLANAVVRYAGASDYPGIYVRDQNVSISDSVISDNGAIGLYELHVLNTAAPSVTITNTDISNQDYGLYLDSLILNISNSNIHDNNIYGAYTAQYSGFNGANNYWGDMTGPYSFTSSPNNLTVTSNPAGLGNRV
ncbi:MAG TPA: immunoglobulin-like domain-containing protein, partial [Candidatus Paceibacterota bacterium]|nr:immunoglobulin-like domain-containing protein [Candidatus Paceibacterota bacterium]